MSGENDFKLPRLAPRLKVFAGAPDPVSGEPTGILHDPLSNNYYKLNWVESECLARISSVSTASTLKKNLEDERGIKVDIEDIKALSVFLISNGLTEEVPDQALGNPQETGFLKKLIHRYLYFTLPLFHPQKILDQLYPRLSWFFSPLMNRIILSALVILGIITFERSEEFLNTYPNLFSLSGAIRVAAIFVVIKVIHEWAHALTATKHKIPVPHMGIAFIVLYPVLYTETSGAWRLGNRKDRAEIGFAGIRAELAIATLALLVWNISDAGSISQIISFLVVAISLVSSLLVNLNPLMRFDGYYILSDYTGIENLQGRACAYARWKLREILFDLKDPEPEQGQEGRRNFLILFGFSLLIYRFFLFGGIAILVYYLFFKPLGLILFLVEIWYFILNPILSELKIWNMNRAKIWEKKRTKYTAVTLGLCAIIFILPVRGTVTLQAVAGYKQTADIHAPYPSRIEKVSVRASDRVEKGDELIMLSSPELERDLKLAYQDLKKLEAGNRQNIGAVNGLPSTVLDEKIDAARHKITLLEEQKEKLFIKAPFAGEIRDAEQGLEQGRYLKPQDRIFRVVSVDEEAYTAYLPEGDEPYVTIGNHARFIAESTPLESRKLEVTEIERVNRSALDDPELASLFGGEITSRITRKGEFSPSQGLYRISFGVAKNEKTTPPKYGLKTRGFVEISGKARSPMISGLKSLWGLMLRELEWN